MPTLRQKKVAKKIVENLTSDTPMTAGEIVESSGYGPSMKKNSQVVMNSEGVQTELAKLGFTLDAADETVAFLLKHAEKEETQLNAADKIYKRLGGYAPDKHISLNIAVDEPDERLKELAKRLNG
jgi:Holliday junction resolvasome RuvABC DNA-binding subunit